MADAVTCPLWVLGRGLTPAALRIYLAICAHQGRHREAWPSQDRLATLCACSVAQVRRAVAELKRAGLITAKPLHGCRHITYIVQAQPGLATPTPCISARATPAPTHSKDSLEAGKGPKTAAATAARPRRAAERPKPGLGNAAAAYIRDQVYLAKVHGRLQVSEGAYRMALYRMALEGTLRMHDADAIHDEADKMRKAGL